MDKYLKRIDIAVIMTLAILLTSYIISDVPPPWIIYLFPGYFIITGVIKIFNNIGPDGRMIIEDKNKKGT